MRHGQWQLSGDYPGPGHFGNGVFVLTGNGGGSGGSGGTSSAIVTSDSEKITSKPNDLTGQGRIVFGGGHFVMMTDHKPCDMTRSKDDIEWIPVVLPGEGKVSWLVSTGDTLLAGNSKIAYASTDAF